MDPIVGRLKFNRVLEAIKYSKAVRDSILAYEPDLEDFLRLCEPRDFAANNATTASCESPASTNSSAPQANAAPSPAPAPAPASASDSDVTADAQTEPEVADDGSGMDYEVALEPEEEPFTLFKGNKKGKRLRQDDEELDSSATPAASKAQKLGTSPGKVRKVPVPAAPKTTAQSRSNKKDPTPPPVFIQDKSRWAEISSACNLKKIAYLRASSTSQGIRVQVPTSADHRAFTSLLDSRNVYYHTYALEEEKKLRVIVRGLPKELSTELILEDLKSQSIPVEKVHRLTSPRNGKTYDMVHVTLEKSEAGKAIFNLPSICHLSGLRFEPPRKTGVPGQCHNCQLYGHSSRHCHAKPRCVKCTGDHGTPDCSRPKKTEDKCSDPPSCVLCGETGHPANYRGCPSAPRINSKVQVRSALRNAPGPAAQAPPKVHQTDFPPLPPKAPQAEEQSVTLRPTPAWPLRQNPKCQAPPPAAASQPPQVPSKPNPKPNKPSPSQALKSEMTEALTLVSKFTQSIDFPQIIEFARAIRANEGNGIALFQSSIEFISILESMANFRCSP